MKCPHCGAIDDRVLDTRVLRDGGIRRRRECNACKGRYSTVETVQVQYPYVVKKDGRREAFDKEKLRKGLQLACQKRPIALSQIEALVGKISRKILDLNEKEVSSLVIGHEVMRGLKALDHVAYVRFASVYRAFKDIQEFVQTLESETEAPEMEL